ncbi:hypothetical protein BEN71_13590 [Acinetobacter wuhouensis]|uniref:Uncharacterized protein n=1 Tax=Acinetobacter wuhouensis TaxID=1879050 RepID=A0A385C5T0_9GAMM|nr:MULTISPECIES: hypothetical protein [Acinetobacter]AXQ23048.1 hypothetical protein BEN71_13590 [Acinetobacter wuhouensis]AYO55129.1 hypothetical protein CDG68_16335 [Acinetobacter wuhouensis]RZG82088.1 hypothetical protein EXE10_12225 [Acinetobacter sp. WCHAc060033]
MKTIFPLLMLVAIGNVAHADVKDYLPDLKGILPEAKFKPEDASKLNFGAGVTQQMVHGNAEWVNPYGIAYAKLGAFYNGDHSFAGQVGYRIPVALNGKDKNGFYLGVYGGSLKSRVIDGKDEVQYGAGADLAYVLLDKERISTFSVGMGAGSELHDKNGNMVLETRPQIQISYTLSVGF